MLHIASFFSSNTGILLAILSNCSFISNCNIAVSYSISSSLMSGIKWECFCSLVITETCVTSCCCRPNSISVSLRLSFSICSSTLLELLVFSSTFSQSQLVSL
ncbi:hypothetical protein GDO86_018500 [Hymenochirus boettgeri]|uniref:Secreted protein n=1 Tax=Hymenochirus boettgeri TaxID=247094 RepID=A0A8T2ICS2_9PIPI|nr:hypothetical protein GDO86_018500 [Hymenochirus boettgeri]